MTTREFQYQDGTSSKFWRITQAERACTVQFGRIGTAGQIQTKTFSDQQAAEAACARQIAEKLKKGYREVLAENGAIQPAATPTAHRAETSAIPAAGALEIPAPSIVQPSSKMHSTTEPTLTMIYDPSVRLHLDPTDWAWATWQRCAPLERPAAAAFDRADALQRLRRLSNSAYQWQWEWGKAIPEALTAAEASFWFQALHTAAQQNSISSTKLADLLDTSPGTPLSVDQGLATITGMQYATRPVMVALLVPFLTPEEIMLRLMQAFEQSPQHWYLDGPSRLIQGFRRYVLPYLSQRERERLSRALLPYLKQVQWPSTWQSLAHPGFYFAAMLGGHNALLQRIIQSWPDDHYSTNPWADRYQRPQEILFGLDDPREVEAQFRRLQLRLNQPEYVRAWLAHTGDRALDVVRASIQQETERESAAALTRAFALAVSPAAAPQMLALMQESKAPQIASSWLDEHPSHAIAGLLPLADSRSAQSEAATAILRRLVRRDYGALVEQALADLPENVAARQRANVIAGAQPSLPPFDAQTTPGWLDQAIQSLAKGRQSKLPTWARATDLPSVVVGEQVLNTEQAGGLLRAVQRSKAGEAHPLILALKAHAERSSLDRFAWSLFELWLAEGAPSKENWAFFGLGWLGGDSAALKLSALIRLWPGESQHQRAVNGLECLRMIGSDTALMQINGIAQKVKFKGLQQRAVECMDRIAEERGLSRAELEDRIVPDCDLDERGERIFDYGSRQFRFVLGPEMKPMVRDPQGKLKPNLPPPTTKDDAEQAAQALADWKLLKKVVAEVASVQAVRLEQAMVTVRRWQSAEFESLLVRHPLMTHLVRTLIWGVYHPAGTLSATFRVTEDQSYADAADEHFDLPANASIGLIHPLHLNADDRGAWGEILSDYEIVQPFPQLGRAIQRLEAHELFATDITRFNDLTIPAAALVFGLDKLGWTRDLPADGGNFSGHFKPFLQSHLTAVIQYTDGVSPGWIVDAPDQKILYLAFVPGILKAEYWPAHKDRLPLGEVDPVVISEVLNDLLLLSAKAR